MRGWLRTRIPELANVAGAAGLGTYSLLNKGSWEPFGDFRIAKTIPLVGMSVGVSAIGLLWNRRRGEELERATKRLEEQGKENARLEQEISNLVGDRYVLLEDCLRLLSGRLCLGLAARVSVYGFDGARFVMLGRWSKNPTYCDKGRALYPADQGCIGRAWRNGEHYEAEMPDPVTAGPSWVKRQRALGMPRAVIECLTMQPRCIYGVRIDHPDRGRPLGVLVAESTIPAEIDPDAVRADLAAGTMEMLARFLERFVDFQPDVAYAKREGF